MHYFQEVFAIIKNASVLGECKTTSGATMLGRVPHVAPEAWLHTFYSPLDEMDINLLESEIEIPIPDSFREFLELTNGLNLFSDILSIYGNRTSYDRTLDDREPYSILTPNLYERPKGLRSDALLIGFYSFQNGFSLYIDTRSEKIFRCREDDARPLATWPSFGDMLLSEVRRLDGLFDDRGIMRNKNAVIVPDF